MEDSLQEMLLVLLLAGADEDSTAHLHGNKVNLIMSSQHDTCRSLLLFFWIVRIFLCLTGSFVPCQKKYP